MMRRFLISHPESCKGHGEPHTQRMQFMTLEPGREICNSLQAIQEEIEKLDPENKEELLEAVQKLWEFRDCHTMDDA